MRKFVLYVAVLFCAFDLFAQMDITYGKRFYDIKDDCVDAKIIAEDNSGYYFYYCMNEYMGEGEFEYKYYVAHSDIQGNVDKVAKIDFGSKSFKVEQTWRNNSLVGFILSRSTKDKPKQTRRSSRSKAPVTETGTQKLYTQYLHLQDMRLIEKPELFMNYNYVVDSAQKPFLFSFSENKTKMVFCTMKGDTNGRSAEVKVYNNNMGLLWSKTYSVAGAEGLKMNIEDVCVNNEGNNVLLAFRGVAQGKKVNHKDDIAYLVYLTQYQNKTYSLQPENAWVTSMKCCFNMEGDHMLAGYYGITNDKPNYAAGSFAYTFDKRRLHQKTISMKEFKEYETDEMVAKKKEMPGPSNFVTYVEELVPMVGGNVIMLGEQRFESHKIPPKRRGDKPTGEEAFYYRDLVLSNVDKNGFVEGNAFIAKRQKIYNDNDSYNGYVIDRDRYGLYIMFNDHIDNYSEGKFKPVRQYNSDKLRTQVNFVQVYSDGSFNWQQAFKTHSMKMPFFKTLHLTNTKDIVFLCHWEDNNIFGKFQTR